MNLNMKYKVLSIGRRVPASFINIGDFIQGVAASQFYPHLDGFIDREDLGDYEGEDCMVIMNGWFKHFKDSWPPSSKIHPIFLSFHINSTAKDFLLSEESLTYYKKYEPIGCRDVTTRDILLEHGINAYFSGCMTLTLGENFKSEEKSNNIYFVDPYFSFSKSPQKLLKNFWGLLRNYKKIKAISDKFDCCWWCKSYKKLFITAYFYNQYSQLFSDELLLNATYICQESSKYKDNFSSPDELFEEAKRLINIYAKAKFVITSRIHCALPCLGIETPVIYIENKEQDESSYCRLEGIRDLFKIIEFTNGKFKLTFNSSIPITSNSTFTNKDNWKSLAHNLKISCSNMCNA